MLYRESMLDYVTLVPHLIGKQHLTLQVDNLRFQKQALQASVPCMHFKAD